MLTVDLAQEEAEAELLRKQHREAPENVGNKGRSASCLFKATKCRIGTFPIWITGSGNITKETIAAKHTDKPNLPIKIIKTDVFLKSNSISKDCVPNMLCQLFVEIIPVLFRF